MNNRNKTYDQLKAELQELQHSHDLLEKALENNSNGNVHVFTNNDAGDKIFRKLYEFSGINCFTLNANEIIVNVNPSWLQTLGYTREKVEGHHFSEFLSPESAERLKTLLTDSNRREKNHDFELNIFHKDGTSLVVIFEAKNITDDNGNYLETLCIFTDITQEKKNKESILIKEHALESALAAFAISDLKGLITYINPAFCKLWGYVSPDEVIGKSVTEFWQSTGKAIEAIETVQQSGTWTGELVALKKSGEETDMQVSASIVKDDGGRSLCMLASFADISNHKQAEIVKTENEISYRELFDNVADAIYIQDEEGTFLDVNEGAVKMYGHPRDVLVGKNPQFVSAPGKNDLDAIAAMIELANAGEPQQFEFWGQRANGEIFPKEVRIVSGTYFGKKVLIAMAQDITERKKAETALQASERKYRELIELAVDGILIGSPDGTIIGANTYMQNLTGRSLENLFGTNIGELFNSNILKDRPLRFDLLKKGETVFSERDIKGADGKIIPIEMHTKMMPDGTYQSIYHDITERKKAEVTIKQSEGKYKSLVESTSDIIWETNTEGLYTYLSPQFKQILGYSPEESLGKSPYDFISDDLLSEVNARIDTSEETMNPFYLLVNKFKHQDGHLVHFETSGVPVYDHSGKHTGFRGVSRDISKRYQAEKELHKLSAVVHQSPNTIIITDLDGKIEYVNPSGCNISGYSFDELSGKSPSIFSSGETSRKTYKSLWNTIKAGNEWKGILCNKKKNGELFWESVSILPVKDAEGIITHYLALKEDISKSLQAERELKESEERYRKLFESSPDAIILADIETGMLIDANTSACMILGRSLDEIRQLHQSMIHPPKTENFSKVSFLEHIQKADSNENLQPVENFILRSDGCEIPVEVLASKITLNGRQILQGVFRDITERKQVHEELLKAKEKAEASDKLKSAFLNNISHELRTPLNGIIGFSEMITQMDSTDEDRLEFSKMIKKSSTRLINTITSYMDISIIVSGITEINTNLFSLNHFFDKISDQTIEICDSRNLKLNIVKKSQTKDFQIETDEHLLSKIFSYLIDNAIKFTKEGSITLSHEINNGFHQFGVSDTGMGISKESLSVIFEVFMQADLSTSRTFSGSGLGLSIAQGFVKLLGGNIWVDSKINEGSTFFFTIPAKPKTNSAQIENIENQDTIKSTSPLILVAEDEDSNYKYLEIILKKASYAVLRAKNGFESIDICRTNPNVKLLLTDLKMPGMDGFESTRQIRTFLPGLPIIVLSAFVTSSGEAEAKSAGCTEYIEKPVNKAKLLVAIDRILSTNIN